MTLVIEQFICRSDNFGVLIHEPESKLTAAIDAPEAAPIRARLRERNWKLDHIFVTHHHADHTDGNLELKQEYGCRIVGPAGQIPGIDEVIAEGSPLSFGREAIQVLATPGHTLDHLSLFLPAAQVAFVADTLFSLGCGRVIEGTMPMMWSSLEKLLKLPDETQVYCGHEYTEANARFALTIEPENGTLVTRAREVSALRAAGKMTLPTTLGLEKATNPFLRPGEAAIRARLGMEKATDAEVFGEIRRRKDNFK